ncbi:MAG TPA: DUF1801 domain-containing protein [Pyrinomonadaceae bacterium]|nr:DUF1801 domain-containing protein [Pyrinomonadaceae bacterium]
MAATCDRKHPVPKELVKFLKPYDSAIQELALRLRDLVLKEMAPCHENIYDAYSAVAIGYGWSERMKDGVFHVAVYTNHVNLGFNFGASLPDPLGILDGKGNQIRHISISDTDALERPEIRSYIRRALRIAREDARKLGETLPVPPRKVVSVVKAIYPKKRRPATSSRHS